MAPTARVTGRILRLAVGVALVWDTFRVVSAEDIGFNVKVLGAAAGLLVFYAIAHVLITTRAARINAWGGAVVALAPVVLTFTLGGAVGRVAAVGYVGISLVVQAALGDGGCEVMALPGLLARKRTHLVCILFSPIDWIERRFAERAG